MGLSLSAVSLDEEKTYSSTDIGYKGKLVIYLKGRKRKTRRITSYEERNGV